MYRLEFRPAALRAIRKLDSDTQARVHGALVLLGREPRPPGSRKLTGRDAYRVRVGHHRIIYAIDDAERVVVVAVIGHRSNAYR